MTTSTAPSVLITGNTYPVRQQMRDLGGTWDKARQGWQIPADKADAAKALVAQAGPASARTPRTRSYGRRSYGYSSRASYTRCTHEDYPCCGCER